MASDLLLQAQASAKAFLEAQRVTFNKYCAVYEAWQVALGSVLLYILVAKLWGLLFAEKPLFQRAKLFVFRNARKLPFVAGMIKKQMKGPLEDIENSMFKHTPASKFKELPAKGMEEASMLKLLKEDYQPCGNPVARHQSGKVSGTIYVGGPNYESLSKILSQVYGMFAWTNPLHPGVFPGVRQMEAEVVSMCCALFGGGPDTCGAMTAGGTESIITAMKAYRDWARDVKGISNPNVVAPATGHPALDKACQYFNINLRKIAVDPVTCQANVRAMRRAIDGNTIALFASCPQYPHGCVDPIAELAAIALKRNIGMHVDCCLGSFLVCFMKKAGFQFPAFDFSVPGVTSISADTHKYGMAPKGSSVIMYSSHALRHYQYSVFPDWPGGIYGTPGIAGSRPGALIAATWAAMMNHGEEGYVNNTKNIIAATRKVTDGIKKIKGLKLVCNPDVSVVAWTSDVFDINRSVEPMTSAKGWDLNVLQFPSSIHLCVTLAHTSAGVVDSFLSDLSSVTAELMKDPDVKPTGAAAMYGMAQTIPDRSIIVELVHGFIDTTYQVEKIHDGGAHGKDSHDKKKQ